MSREETFLIGLVLGLIVGIVFGLCLRAADEPGQGGAA